MNKLKAKKRSKRVKINFDTINKGIETIIPAKDITESKDRIAKEMRKNRLKEYFYTQERWQAISHNGYRYTQFLT